MDDKLENLLVKYQGNAWPAMLQSLANQLGVSSDSLKRLELGWAPIVSFKKGPNYQGWWVIPERDDDGGAIGLSLRSQSGFKCMYPGSKHGLVYELNPNHEKGLVPYKHGAHNWTRLYDAGVDCPVCGKPDGCMVSSEDVDDPAAVICIRSETERPMKFGHLHILKDEGHVRGASVLPPSDYPVVVVEGMTDTAAAMDIGCVAVGRPSNLAGLDMLVELLRGRDVIVVGENDEINPQTGQRPGYEGMVGTFQMLKGVASSIRQVMPPEHVKDLRKWVSKGGLSSAEELVAFAEQHGHEPQEQKVLEDERGLTLARAFLNARYRLNGKYILRYDRGRWFEWDGVKYVEVDDRTSIRGPIHNWAYDKQVLHTTPKGEQTIKPLNCNITMVNNMLDSFMDPACCPIPKHTEPPCWLNDVDGPDPEELIVFNNGILWFTRYLWADENTPQSEYFFPHTPDFFTTFALPFPFDETAKCRLYRMKVREMLGQDFDKINLYQEWGGYILTPMTKYQKLMLMRGPAGAGKSLLAGLLGEMVGPEQWVAPSFSDMASDFGLQDLIGKQVAIMDEAKVPQSADAMKALETILKITGEGTFNIQRKYLTSLSSYKFATKFTLTCNELPNLPDPNGAMTRRLLILDFPRSFEDKADPDLHKKLRQELPGIILWHLKGLKRLMEAGRFTTPVEMKESIREWNTATSPMAAFIEECCDQDKEYEVPKEKVYDAWRQWAEEHGMRTISKTRMFERFKGNSLYVTSDSYMKEGHKHSVFRGIKLKPWAERRLLGKPNTD